MRNQKTTRALGKAEANRRSVHRTENIARRAAKQALLWVLEETDSLLTY